MGKKGSGLKPSEEFPALIPLKRMFLKEKSLNYSQILAILLVSVDLSIL
jgi:hypothetical protein